ncbi:unnamed protein product [Coffea canephora]|uniref:Uncharacterized protein n=1 Tax=Coffea canephora TaxID=49390 RepID=A0A068V533_COFCA|nr:unnamed protein product [Coffea canephora]
MASSSGNKHPPPQPTPPSRAASAATPPIDEDQAKWGTRIMAQPAAPTTHPDNQRAASWRAEDQQHPYVVYSPVEKPSDNPLESVVHIFNCWSYRAETVAKNIWYNCDENWTSCLKNCVKKLNLTTKALTEGGFELLLVTFQPQQVLLLELSTLQVAFCSDSPLSFRAPSGQETWNYYMVMIPLANIANVNPVVMKEGPPEKYIQIVTID